MNIIDRDIELRFLEVKSRFVHIKRKWDIVRNTCMRYNRLNRDIMLSIPVNYKPN